MGKVKRPKRRRQRTFLREWRKYRQLTQAQASERLNLDPSTLSRIERGDIPYNQDFLEEAAYAYMCEPADLIMRNPLNEDAVWSIADQLKTVPPEEQARVRAVIDALTKKTGS